MAQRITLQGSDRSFLCSKGETLLHAGLKEGLGFPYECASGTCGTCQFQLIDGTVETIWSDAPGLSPRARRKGDRFLACQCVATSDCVISSRMDDRYICEVRPSRFEAVLKQIVPLTRDMAEFRFASAGEARFLPGQFVLLEVPTIDGRRAYSMANLANEVGGWHLIIKRKDEGALTRFLFEGAEPGLKANLLGPYGSACLTDQIGERIVLLAGGSGLSPALSIARGALEGAKARKLSLYYGARTQSDLVDLKGLLPGPSNSHERLDYVPVLSEQEWDGLSGFLHEAAEANGAIEADTDYFIAGPGPMVEASIAMLKKHGVKADRVHYDSFG